MAGTGELNELTDGTLQVPQLLALSATDAITAHAGGGQANAVALTTGINRVTTVGTAADSVKLPPTVPGLLVVVINAGGAALAVFPSSGDAINALSADAVLSVAVNKGIIFFCAVAGKWQSVLTA